MGAAPGAQLGGLRLMTNTQRVPPRYHPWYPLGMTQTTARWIKIHPRISLRLRDRVEAYRLRHGYPSLNAAIISLLVTALAVDDQASETE